MLKKTLLFFILLLNFPIILFAQKDSTQTEIRLKINWEYYSSEEGNFKIKFPAEPISDRTAQTIKLLHKRIKYEVIFDDNHRHKDLHSSKHLLNSKTNEFVRKLNKFHRVETDTSLEIRMLGLNSQETWLKYNELGKTTFIVYRILITHDHIYELVLRQKDKRIDENIKNTFFDSFHLLDNQIIRAHWHTHTSSRGNFKIDLPAEAIINTNKNYQIITSNIDEVSCQMYYPTEMQGYQMDKANEILDKTIENLQNELGKEIEVELESSENLQMLGYPAKEARFSVHTAGITIKIIFRALLTPKELFQFQIVSPYEYIDENTAHRFFDSFEILGK